jgi:hypothetical protein
MNPREVMLVPKGGIEPPTLRFSVGSRGVSFQPLSLVDKSTRRISINGLALVQDFNALA